MVPVSPFHQIELAEVLQRKLEHPGESDYVVRRISQKTVNGQPLIQGELVVSGTRTLEEFPLAREFPVHFRKTYYPICFHQDPAREYENHLAASEIIPVPPPIGSTRTSFRSCFLPGKPYSSLSPFGVEPEEGNLPIAEGADPAALIGLWTLLAPIYDQIQRLHEAGFAHGDLFLHNVIVSLSPVGGHLIDFELATRKSEAASEEEWQAKVGDDFREILTEAVHLQCALGAQQGPLAEAAIDQLPALFKNPDRFRRAIEAGSGRVG